MRERRKKIDPIARLIEAILDLALITGLLSAVGFLISITARLSFDRRKQKWTLVRRETAQRVKGESPQQ